MSPFLYNIRQFLSRLSPGQQVALACIVLGAVALLSGIAYWAGRPDYALLFGRLDPADASKVVEALQSQGVKYELREHGTAIFVPRDRVYELRLYFAGEGLISDGPVGYELFDQGTLGMTDFMQKLNLKRALEGELARTIASVRQVELARVHLVIPERSPFRDAQIQPSASVVLQLASSARLSREQIEGITALVAGAVEGLAPADVTVLDTRGNLLSDPSTGDPAVLAGSSQLRLQRALEAHLTEKGQSMLDRVLGPGNAIVRVAAALDFSRAVSERDVIDPESATIISEERLEELGGAEAAANSTVRNYELSRTRERSEKSVGEIAYLTVSVILNQKQPAPEPDAPAAEPAPYASAELAEVESLVKNAVGFNPERGDRFAIHQTRFDTSVDHRVAEELQQHRQEEQLQLYLRYGLMVLALGLAAWLIRSAARRVSSVAQHGEAALLSARADGPSALEAHRSRGLAPSGPDLFLVDDLYRNKLSPDARQRLMSKHLLFEEIKQHVTANPSGAADLVRTWLAEDAAEEA